MSHRSTLAASIALSLALLALAGCAARPVSPAEDARVADCERCTSDAGPARSAQQGAQPDEGSSLGGARSRTLSLASSEEPLSPPRASRWDVRRIGGSAAAEESGGARPRRTKKVDIDLAKAPFDDVMRFLGDTGKFNVVVQDVSAGDVTLRLRDVEPYDALLVIAEARGIPVDYRRGVVVVGSGGK